MTGCPSTLFMIDSKVRSQYKMTGCPSTLFMIDSNDFFNSRGHY